MNILNSGVGNFVISGGRKFSYFGGNNYLGLANHPMVKEAAIKAIEKYGVNFSASRRTTGTADIHLELEGELSHFKGKEDSVVFASGYLGNRILLDTLKSSYSSVYIDQLAHPSITDSIPVNITDIQFYNHCDPDHLEQLLKSNAGKRSIIITDGLFALTGEIAPLDKIYQVAARYNSLLVVDDAHSTGVLGKSGKGTPEYFNIQDKGNVFQTETMSKALGSYGGFISGSKDLVELIRENSKPYQSSTALPPPLLAAGNASLKLMRENPGLSIQLLEKAGALRKAITSTGYLTTPDITPIVPILFGSAEKAMNLSGFLEQKGIIIPFMNYPVKHDKFILRIAVSAAHTQEQTDQLLDYLTKWKNKNGTY